MIMKLSNSGDNYASHELVPYTQAIGQLVLAWNDLHENLAALFATITGDMEGFKMYPVWQSSTSDRAKREMLAAVITAGLDKNEKCHNPKAQEDIRWLLKQIDTLEGIRNDAVHTPIRKFTPSFLTAYGLPIGIHPDYLREHKRALRLKGKNILAEYKYCRDIAAKLGDFADQLENAWCYTEDRTVEWPTRPRITKPPSLK